MKKLYIYFCFGIILLGLFAVISACGYKEPVKIEPRQIEDVTGKYALELQSTACSSADIAGTCETKLASLGFITKEECCERYKKCC